MTSDARLLVAQAVQRRLVEVGSIPSGAPLETLVTELVDREAPLLNAAAKDQSVADVLAQVTGLGPLDPYAQDADVSDIIVNGDGEIHVDGSNGLIATGQVLSSDVVLELARRLAASVGRTLDRSRPFVDARLVDGSRLHAVIAPIAVDGPLLTIRRFGKTSFGLTDYTYDRLATLLSLEVASRANVVICGATSSGKTSLLNALSAHIDVRERVITIEEAAELQLLCPHVARLECRVQSEGVEAVGLEALVRQALRMRPDRIICGEMRGPEAFALIQAMNTGHDGSMSTVHARNAIDAMSRIETLMLLARSGLPLDAIREQLARTIDLVVFVGRGNESRRSILECGRPQLDGDCWSLQPLGDMGDGA